MPMLRHRLDEGLGDQIGLLIVTQHHALITVDLTGCSLIDGLLGHHLHGPADQFSALPVAPMAL